MSSESERPNEQTPHPPSADSAHSSHAPSGQGQQAHEPHRGHGHQAAKPHSGTEHSASAHRASGSGHSQHAPAAHRQPGATHPDRRRRILWIVVAAVLVLIGGCVLLNHPAKKKAAPNGGATPVATAPVKTGNIDVTLNTLGIVTPEYTVTVTSRVTGAITEVRYQEGQTVHKNDLLVVIDPRPYAAAVTQGEGQLARDQALLENAWIDLARYQDAFKSHAIPEQQVATQQALVKEDEGTVELDQGNLEAAKTNLDYTQIRSPIDGRVGLRQIDPGNIVVAGGTTPLVTITQLQPITVIFNLAEDYLGEIAPALKPGHPLRVDALDRTQKTLIAQGSLITLDNQINVTTGTVRARATFANAKDELCPNQFVNAKLYIKTLTGVTLVPAAAIQRNDTVAYVYVIQPNQTVKSTPVTITATQGEISSVTGISAGAQLVTDGFEKLQDGSKISVRQPGQPKTATNPPAAGKKTPDAPGSTGGGS